MDVQHGARGKLGNEGRRGNFRKAWLTLLESSVVSEILCNGYGACQYIQRH